LLSENSDEQDDSETEPDEENSDADASMEQVVFVINQIKFSFIGTP